MIRHLFAIFLLLSTPALSAECKNGAVYVAQENTEKEGYSLTTGPNGPSDKYVFEKWGGKSHIWTVTAGYACSNGILFCSLDIPTNQERIGVGVTYVEASSGEQLIVLDHLTQWLMSSYQRTPGFEVNAVWKEEDRGDGMVLIPNVFKFHSCR